MAEGVRPAKKVLLSKRMQMLADMVTAGSRVADVGCDHAFLSIYLVQAGMCPKCLAMDVRRGPLSGAEEHIAAYGLGEYIETRLSDGLTAYHIGEAQTLVCSGMGGRLMKRILEEGGDKTRSFTELILQPQSEIPEFRIFLRETGFLVTEEEAVYEEGKYYFAMKAVYAGQRKPAGQGMPSAAGEPAGQGMPSGSGGPIGQEMPSAAGEPIGQRTVLTGSIPAEHSAVPEKGLPMEQELYDLFGKLLLQKRHPVLKQYLLNGVETVGKIIAQLQRQDSPKGEARLRELLQEKRQLEKALEFWGKGR